MSERSSAGPVDAAAGPVVRTAGIHHVRYTVPDVAQAAQFFQDSFEWPVVAGTLDTPQDPAVLADPFALFGGAVLEAGPDLLFGLRPATEPGNRNRHPEQPGVDHLSFAVEDLLQLHRAEAGFRQRGIECGKVVYWPALQIAILDFRGPGGAQLELTADLATPETEAAPADIAMVTADVGEGPLARIRGIHHVRFTVPDVAQAAQFFQDSFGWQLAAGTLDTPQDPAVLADPYQLFGGAVLEAGPDLLFGLRPATKPGNRNHHPEQPGMDHLSLRVPSVAHLDHAHAALGQRNVNRGDVTDWPELGLTLMSLPGPAGMQLELAVST